MVYNAGTAFLQVVPSFRGIRDAFEGELRHMGAQADASLGKTFQNLGDKLGHEVNRGMDEGVAHADKKGKDAGEKFSGAFATSMRRRLEAAWGSIPKVKIEADSSDVDREVQSIRKSMIKLKRDFGKEKISADGLVEGMRAAQARLDEVKRNAENVELFRNTKVASGELETALREAEEFIAQRFNENGRRSGDEFAGSFSRSVRRNLEAAQHALPDINLDADVSKVDRKLAKIKAKIADLREAHIRGDINSKELIAKTTKLMAQLEAITKSAKLDVEGHANIRSSQDGLRSVLAFAEAIKAENERAIQEAERAGEEAGTRWGGAYGRAARRRIEAALQALPEVDPKLATTQIDKDIARIRERLQSLRDLHINGKIDSAQLIAEAKAIQAELDNISKHGTIDLRTRTNVAGGRDQLREMLADFGIVEEEARKAGRRSGEEFAGHFARTVQAKMAAAAKAFPDIEITADSSKADKSMAGLRARFEALQKLRIGVDIDAAKAMAQMQALQAALEAITKNAANAELKANATAALAEVKAAVESIGNQGKEAGQKFADEFDRSVRTRLATALKALPEATVGLDTGPADEKLADIRLRMAELSDKTIGVNISEAEAMAQIATLQAELARLARESPDIRVRTNATAASAELVQVLLLANRVNSADPKINIRVAGAQAIKSLGDAADVTFSRLGFMIALGTSIGSVLVPAAGAAAAAIGGIATAASAGVAGIGVLVLGLSGIGSAVQALNKYENDQQKSAAALTSSENRVAGSLDSVNSAERSLANTRASVAAAEQRNAQQIVDAQKSIVDSQREALKARQDLTKAFEEARRQREDEALALRSNALAQRQAVLDVADAKKALDKVLADKTATEADREQAKITYEQRVLQLEDLGLKAKRMAVDQAEADRKGIQGSDQVVAAQERIKSTSDAVAKAQQHLADAITSQQEQQRQGAYQIAQASQAVVAAQRQVENASVKAGVAGGAALSDLHWQMSQLGPAGQHFAQFLFGLKGEFKSLRDAAQGSLLPGLETAITMLLPYLPRLRTFVADIAQALGDMAVQAVSALGDPVWREWFSYIGKTAVPALKGMAQFTFDIARGMIGLLNALTPFNAPMGKGLLDMAAGFAKWATTLEHSAGFQHFFEYVMTNGPKVLEFFGNLWGAAVQIVKAWAPVGVAVLAVLDGIVSGIKNMPLGYLTAIVLELSLFATALLGVAAYTKIAVGFEFIAKGILLVTTAWQNLMIFMKAGVAVNFANNLTTMGAASNTFAATAGAAFKTAGQAATSALGRIRDALTGPLGVTLAVGAATIAIGYFIQKAIDQKNRIDSLKGALLALGDAYRKSKDFSSESVKGIILNNDHLSDLIRNTKLYGLSVETVTKAASGDKEAQKQVIAAIDARNERLKDLQDEEIKAGRSNLFWSSERTKSAAAERGVNAERKKALLGEFDQIDRNAEINGKLDDEQRRVADSAARHVSVINEQAMPAFAAQFNALMKVRDANASAADKVTALREADQALFDTQRNKIRGDEDAALATQAWNTIVLQATQGQLDASQALTLNTDLSKENLQAVVDNRRALEDKFTSLNSQFFATVALTGEVDKASVAHETEKQKLIDAAKAAGFDAGEIGKIADAFGTIPTDPKVSVNVFGVADVMTQMSTIQIATWALEHGITDPTEAVHKWAEKEAQAQNALDESRARARRGGQPIPFATGGFVSGPGGPTDDQIPAWLSNGEYVIPAVTVRKLGIGFFDGVIGRRSPQSRYPGDGSQGIAFAQGGPVRRPTTQPGREATWPAAFDFRKYLMDIIVKREAERLANRKAQAESGVPYFGEITADIASAQRWLRAQAGKPYGWAEAGPISYDCSGIISAVWNILHGRNPYQHTFSTSNEAAFFPEKGSGGVLTAGWSNPGEGGPGGGANDVGHTAGVLAGLAFESRGGDGVVVGSGVTSVRRFAHLGHFDRGGYLQPGVTMVLNGTGRPEPVLTGRQWSDVSNLASDRTGGTGGNQYHFAFRDTTLDVSKLRALQNADAVRARVGRPR